VVQIFGRSIFDFLFSENTKDFFKVVNFFTLRVPYVFAKLFSEEVGEVEEG